MDLNEIQNALGTSHPKYRASQVYEAVYGARVRDIASMTSLPKAVRDEMERGFSLGWPRVAAQYESVDGTRRYLLELADGRTVETVLMPEDSRDTICISSQVGCPVNCQFCLTALMGLERNLTAGEIAGQTLFVMRENGLTAGQSRLNVVMMGMGEPLLNLANVLKAVDLLTGAKGAAIPLRRIAVSTSGILPAIEELGRAPGRPKLAISLNASTEEQRRMLMPITRKYHLRDLLEVCRGYPLRPWEKLTFEYVLLKDVNDTDADARRVAQMLANLRAIVNLIALNPGPGIPYGTPGDERVAAFQAIVRRSVPCFVRKPRGRDIFAACGQLRRIESPGRDMISVG